MNNVQPPAVGFHAAILMSSKVNPALNLNSPAKGHNITRSVSVLSNLSVYCGVKQGIYCLNLFKGFETMSLAAYHRGFKNIYSVYSQHVDSSHKNVWRHTLCWSKNAQRIKENIARPTMESHVNKEKQVITRRALRERSPRPVPVSDNLHLTSEKKIQIQ